MWAERYYELIKQELPKNMGGRISFDDFVHVIAIYYVNRESATDISLFPQDDEEYEQKYGTIEYCEEAYKRGFSAIINDGKLLGFRREKSGEK